MLTFACTNDIKETNGKPSMINSLIDFGEAEYFTGVIGQTILFDIDNTDLNESARYILTSQAVWLIENNKYTIIINGYTDELGTRKYNFAPPHTHIGASDFLVLNGALGSN